VHRRRAQFGVLLVLATALALTATACGSDGSGAVRPSTSTTRRPNTTTPSSTTPTIARGGGVDGARITLTPLAKVDGLTALAVRPGDDALYVTQQPGLVRAYRAGALVEQPVLDIRAITSSGGERGLLGLAFSRDGSRLYVDHTNRDGDTRVAEYTMRADGTADPASRRELLAIAQPQPNHNGGSLVLGPDGMLYVGMGDGGTAGDAGPGHAPGGNGQSTDTLLGKLLRIDPTPSAGRPYTIPAGNPFPAGGGRPEIWAYGLRNPWKLSFDRTTGDLLIADVGQNQWEEIDWVPTGTPGGLNFGWNIREGTHPYRDGPTAGLTDPVLEYSHASGRCSIAGGYVYRGRRIPALAGAYLYSDLCDGRIRATPVGPGVATREVDLGVDGGQVVGFGEDAAGELYVLSQSEGLLRIDPSA